MDWWSGSLTKLVLMSAVTPPTFAMPSQVITNSGRLSMIRPTTSPCWMPWSIAQWATALSHIRRCLSISPTNGSTYLDWTLRLTDEKIECERVHSSHQWSREHLNQGVVEGSFWTTRKCSNGEWTQCSSIPYGVVRVSRCRQCQKRLDLFESGTIDRIQLGRLRR